MVDVGITNNPSRVKLRGRGGGRLHHSFPTGYLHSFILLHLHSFNVNQCYLFEFCVKVDSFMTMIFRLATIRTVTDIYRYRPHTPDSFSSVGSRSFHQVLR